MKQWFAALFVTLALLAAGCAEKDQALSPRAFSRQVLAKLREALPDSKVILRYDLQLQVSSKGGTQQTVSLDNAYKEYQGNPQNKEDIITRYVASLREVASYKSGVDRSRIVPIIKDRPWIEEARAGARKAGAKEDDIPLVTETLNEQLVIVYAEDTPANLRYLSPKDLQTAGVARDALRALAVTNLKTVAPKYEIRGGDGLYLLVCGGNFEVSLLLLDELWASGQLKVKGDYVVGLPSRDVLMVTGSEETDILPQMREKVRSLAEAAPYRLTTDLFVRRDGRFVKFDH